MQTGLTLARYAEAKQLPEEFLRGRGVGEIAYYQGGPAVRILYYDESGTEAAVRFRLGLDEESDTSLRWRKRSKPLPYGLDRLHLGRDAGHIVLVDGESDCHALWLNDIPALGIPGAETWKDGWAEYLADIPVVYAVVEAENGEHALLQKLLSSPVRDRLRIIRLQGNKHPSDLYLTDPNGFLKEWQAALDAAVHCSEEQERVAQGRKDDAWVLYRDLAREPCILDVFVEDFRAAGVVGEDRYGKLLYLAFTSRFLDRPVSLVAKGLSSTGKSYGLERALRFFPSSAYYALSSMSERALAYSDEPLEHRMLVIYEATGLRGGFMTYLVRSLLSEGRIRYETVESTSEGLRPRVIEREGPTGLIVTTTSIRLHPENETRMLSVPLNDTSEQTQEILRRLADGCSDEVDTTRWVALQEWLETGEHRVFIPFARTLVELIPPIAVRLRRDIGQVFQLIEAHTLLHQATRERDAEGRVIATLDDYTVVRELVADLISEGVEATVPETMRETVAAVEELTEGGRTAATISAVAKKLGLDPSAAWRRVQAALGRGYLVNIEERKRRPAALQIGEPPPKDLEILPHTDRLREAGVCTFAEEQQGTDPPSPPADKSGTGEPDPGLNEAQTPSLRSD